MKKDVATTPSTDLVDEICEDMILVGPGQMLSEARKKLSLTQDAVAEKLNFRAQLVANIENDIFDPHLPATFNRGYLRNYAKLVAVDEEEVLAAYDLLGQAEVQRSEMQSFSNLTEKQAEHSRLMWISYLIFAILIGLMVIWWMQTPTTISPEVAPVQVSKTEIAETEANNTEAITAIEQQGNIANTTTAQAPVSEPLTTINDAKTTAIANPTSAKPVVQIEQQADLTTESAKPLPTVSNTENKVGNEALPLATAIFTFSGDCWVNIYDATGERIAWGVKKSGYVMTISGQAPLQVTLGKPELAAINYNGEDIDMSPFNVGNIAKFSLPLSP